MRLRVIKAAQKLRSIKGHQALIEEAAKGATTREEAAYYARATELLAKQPSLSTIVTESEIPAAVNSSGTLILPLAVDYMAWTDVVGPLFENTLSEARSEASAQTTRAVVAGKVSPRCRFELEARDVSIREGAAGLF